MKLENQWNRIARAKIENWLQDEKSSYFDFRAFLSYFDLGLGFLWQGQWTLFTQKLLSLGTLRIPISFRDDQSPTSENSTAIVVTFNPDPEVFENLRRLAEQFGQVVIIDNSPISAHASLDVQKFMRSSRVTLLNNQNRNGLAGAINQGIREVYRNVQSGWVFWFDQDTQIHSDFIEKINLILNRQSLETRQNSLFGVNYEDGKTESKRFSEEMIRMQTVITSGSFTRVENLRRLGLYVDELFIDSLDHEYCLRARRVGMQVNWITIPLMKHSLGRLELRRILWKNDIVITNHPPFRWYYFSRNLIFTAYDGLPWSLPWFFQHGYSLFKNYVKAMILEDQRRLKTQKFVQGMLHGFLLCFDMKER